MFLTTKIFGNFEGWWGIFLTFKTGIPSGFAFSSQHLSNDDCLEDDKREKDYQNCSMM